MGRKTPALNRRGFLALTGSTTAALAYPATASGAGMAQAPDLTADVVVVGSGAAGSTAALLARQAGADVLVLEAADHTGGTSAKSGGNIWIPNNRDMQRRGITDPVEDFLRLAAWSSYPETFSLDAPDFGLPEQSRKLLLTFYEGGPKALQRLEEIGALKTRGFFFGPENGPRAPDYIDDRRVNPGSGKGRVLSPADANGEIGIGDELMAQLGSALARAHIPVLLEHRVQEISRDSSGRVVGVVADTASGPRRVGARKGVIFASGGYTHAPQILARFQHNPVFGGCALATNRGDFIRMAESVGARLGNMTGAWRAQIVLEETLANIATPQDVWLLPGDSSIIVDRSGSRVVNEKRNYHQRAKAMYNASPSGNGYASLLQFGIYDERTATGWAGSHPLPPATDGASYVIKADTFGDLGRKIAERLKDLGPVARGVELAEDFSARLEAEIVRYNGEAKSGVDPRFGRGEFEYDKFYNAAFFPNPGTAPNPFPNPAMHPLSDRGPYYAIILAPGTLDTNGGPVIDEHARVMDVNDQPIPGLYGTGNCIASIARDSYWAAGATLGNAITFGAIAGTHVMGATL